MRAHRLIRGTLAALLVLPAGAVLLALPRAAAAASQSVSIVPLGTSGCSSKYCYQPASVSAASGDMVTWTNNSPASHTVTRCDASACSGQDGGTGSDTLSSSNVGQGQSFSHTFSGGGTYFYYCMIHGYATMHGEVTVSGSGTTTTTTTTTSTSTSTSTSQTSTTQTTTHTSTQTTSQTTTHSSTQTSTVTSTPSYAPPYAPQPTSQPTSSSTTTATSLPVTAAGGTSRSSGVAGIPSTTNTNQHASSSSTTGATSSTAAAAPPTTGTDTSSSSSAVAEVPSSTDVTTSSSGPGIGPLASTSVDPGGGGHAGLIIGLVTAVLIAGGAGTLVVLNRERIPFLPR